MRSCRRRSPRSTCSGRDADQPGGNADRDRLDWLRGLSDAYIAIASASHAGGPPRRGLRPGPPVPRRRRRTPRVRPPSRAGRVRRSTGDEISDVAARERRACSPSPPNRGELWTDAERAALATARGADQCADQRCPAARVRPADRRVRRAARRRRRPRGCASSGSHRGGRARSAPIVRWSGCSTSRRPSRMVRQARVGDRRGRPNRRDRVYVEPADGDDGRVTWAVLPLGSGREPHRRARRRVRRAAAVRRGAATRSSRTSPSVSSRRSSGAVRTPLNAPAGEEAELASARLRDLQGARHRPGAGRDPPAGRPGAAAQGGRLGWCRGRLRRACSRRTRRPTCWPRAGRSGPRSGPTSDR